MTLLAIPQLPYLNYEITRKFYEKLGFSITYYEGEKFFIINLDDIELHFWHNTALNPNHSDISCYIRAETEEEFLDLYTLWKNSNLSESGAPRLEKWRHRSWGMTEFYLIDPNGNLLKLLFLHRK